VLRIAFERQRYPDGLCRNSLERFFGMSHAEAVAHMFCIHNVGKAICGAYSREEAEKKVADVLAFCCQAQTPAPMHS
jgi:ATP-dependent Clp protease adapter protein ClpS